MAQRPLTSAERSKRYRENIKEDLEKYEEYKRKKHENYLKNRKPIAEQTEREQRKTRRGWNKNQKNRRTRLKQAAEILQNADEVTPPQSPETVSPDMSENTRQSKRKSKLSTSTLKKCYQRKIDDVQVQVEKLQVKLKSTQRANQRLRIKLANCGPETPRKCTDKILNESPRKIRKALLFHKVLLAELKTRALSTTTTKDKQVLKKVFSGHIIKKYRMLDMTRRATGIYVNVKRNQRRAKKLQYEPRKYSRFSHNMIPALVRNFFEEDLNSRATPGKKETVTKNGIKKQKRYLNAPIKDLHQKFCNESGVKVSYVAFTRLKPFWVVPNKNRETCDCKKCANTELKINALHNIGELQTKRQSVIMEQMVCENRFDCMYGICNMCKNNPLPYTGENGNDRIIPWYQWENVSEKRTKYENGRNVEFHAKVVKKVKKETDLQTLKASFEKDLKLQKQHVFNIKNQYSATKIIKEKMDKNECTIVIDFSENYSCKYVSEVQSVHFGASRNQVTMHTSVLYSKQGTKSFCSLSANTRHDPCAVWAHMNPILEELRQDFQKINIISDSPSSQYRCTKNFYLFHTLIHNKYEFTNATWNFSESGHGKSSADGIGGVLKRTADSIVNFGREDLENAEKVFSALKNKTAVTLFYITDEDIASVDDMLADKTMKTLKGTMKIHQLISCPGKLCTRDLSCFCSEELDCKCLNYREVAVGDLVQRPTVVVEIHYEDFLASLEEAEQQAPDTEQPETAEQPDTEQPDTEQPDTQQPDTDQSDTKQPDTDQSDTDGPITDKPDTDEPITDKPDTDEPITDQPITDKPDTDQPGTDQPGTDQPDREHQTEKRDIQVGSYVAVALETMKKKRLLYFGKLTHVVYILVLSTEGGEVEVLYMKKYKCHYIWPRVEDISTEPVENILTVNPPKLVDSRRLFYNFDPELIISIKEALNID